MKTCVALAMVINCFVLAGCSATVPVAYPKPNRGGVLVPKEYVAGQGDVGRFILELAVRFGKELSPNENVPLVSREWRYCEYYFSHAITITLGKEDYTAVRLFLDRFFGPPRNERDDGYASYGFTKPVNGGAIHVAPSREDGSDVTRISIYPPVYQYAENDAVESLPPFGELPRARKGWVLREKGRADDSSWNWVILTNAVNGDVLSYGARRIEPGEKRDLISFTDMAHQIFPAGLPAWNSEPKPRVLTTSLRNGVTQLTLISGRTTKVVSQQPALEVSFVQEDEHRTNRLAHGYVLICDDVLVLIQHTSLRAITPEFAHDRAMTLLASRQQEKGKAETK